MKKRELQEQMGELFACVLDLQRRVAELEAKAQPATPAWPYQMPETEPQHIEWTITCTSGARVAAG